MESSKMEVDSELTAETVATKFEVNPNAPTVLIVMGMAGSGKTTFVKVISF